LTFAVTYSFFMPSFLSGYYLQNQASQNSVNLALVNVAANAVRLSPYSPFPQNNLIEGARADAYSIWHLDKVQNGYRFYNEHTRSPLFNTGSNGDALSANPGNNIGDNSVWKLAKKQNTNQIFLQCQDHGRWLALGDANSAILCLQDMGSFILLSVKFSFQPPIQEAKKTGRAGNSFQWLEPRRERSCPCLVALSFHPVQGIKALFLQ
jgi:hypothetical protein